MKRINDSQKKIITEPYAPVSENEARPQPTN